MKCFYRLHRKVEGVIGGVFQKYGRFMANHPVKIVVIVGVIDIGLGLGLLRLETESGIDQYVPTGSQASKDQEKLKSMFSINTTANFYQQSLHGLGLYAEVILEPKSGGNILNHTYWSDVQGLKTFIEQIAITDSNGNSLNYLNLCAQTFGSCALEGNVFFEASFIGDLTGGTISYPQYSLPTGHTFFLDRIIGNPTTASGIVIAATALKLRFNLRQETQSLALEWETKFLKEITSFSNNNITIKYSTSESLSIELSKNVSGDIAFFSITFTLMIIFSCLALMGSNCVDNRYYLGLAGILSTGLAILGSFGLVSLCGVKFVDIVGAMPFLILGIGVDDMFILLSGLADTNSEDDVPTRISQTMKSSGVAITITSITDIIAFCAGAASVFPSVRNFSWYTGCAILFCYINYVTFYIGVMTINEKRVSKNLHWATCCKVKTKEEIMNGKETKNRRALIMCCSGSPHKSRDELEGPIEKYPKVVVKRIVTYRPTKVFIVLFFIAYLGISVWGATQFREDLDIRDLVSKDSYYYSYYDTNSNKFSQTMFVSLNVQSEVNYRLTSTLNAINSLFQDVKADSDVENNFQLSWLHAYMNDASHDGTSDATFIAGLQTFLGSNQGNLYVNDVTISGSTIVSSRFHVKTTSLVTSSSQAAMMERLRDIVKKSSLNVIAFSPAFIFFEQYVQIVPQTLQTLGISVAVVFLVTAIFMPLPVLILLVTISVTMIMVGVIGFMYFWDLTLSSVTMIHIIMCVGFSIDFSTHICHSFVQAEGTDKNERIETALDRSGGPILNGALSSIIGILMLAFSKSFIFFSFFKVMLIVMIFGALHAMFLLPVVLSTIGPSYVGESSEIGSNNEINDVNSKPFGSELAEYSQGTIPRAKLYS